MFISAITICALVASALSRPQEPAPVAAAAAAKPAVKSGEESTLIPIISQTEVNSPDGSFQFSYETGNGIKVDEKGYLKQGQNESEQIQVIEGNVSYTDGEGNQVNLRYIADENGYQPTGDHLPVAPPIPEDIARSLNLTNKSEQPEARSQAQESVPVSASASPATDPSKVVGSTTGQ